MHRPTCSSVSRWAGRPASSTTLLSEPLMPNRMAADTTMTSPLRTASSRVCAGTTASTIRGPYPRRDQVPAARLDVPMTAVVVEGAVLDLVTLAALGVIPARLDAGIASRRRRGPAAGSRGCSAGDAHGRLCRRRARRRRPERSAAGRARPLFFLGTPSRGAPPRRRPRLHPRAAHGRAARRTGRATRGSGPARRAWPARTC